jgi:tripartite-type tricarboxylate transporter receptor subunit TctC
MIKIVRSAVLLTLFVTMGAVSGNSQPGSYPTHPVRVIVHFAPGGVVDVIARLLTQKLTESFGQNFYIDNIGGAGGVIGTRSKAAAPRDALHYTLMIADKGL